MFVLSALFYHIIFLFISLYISLKAIGYGIYEIKVFQNKVGGIVVIAFSIFVAIFSNVMVWMN